MFPPSIANGCLYGGCRSQNACVCSSVPTPRNVVMSGGASVPSPLSVTCHQEPDPTIDESLDDRTNPPIHAVLPITVKTGTGASTKIGTPSSTSRYVYHPSAEPSPLIFALKPKFCSSS